MTDKQIQILIASIELFSEKGYANTSTKEIAKKAGVAEGNIFSKYTSKQGLLNAIITPVIKSILPTAMHDLLNESTDHSKMTLDSLIRPLLKNRVTFLQENAKVLKIFISELLYDKAVVTQLLENAPAPYWTSINSTIDVLKEKNLIVDWDNLEILKVIWSIIGGIVLGYLLFDQPLTEESITHSTDALIKALSV
ncbi:TetR/AcrR family transcriptional regulator [Dellaglioa sp. BT-FLS60]